jgi:hypothetical protein
MIYYGDFAVGSTVRIPLHTFDKDDGSSITLTGNATSDIEVFKNGGTTERASDNGYTFTVDFDTRTGLHLIVIDTSDNSDTGFFAAGNEYQVAVDSVTVDGSTVRAWVGTFSIERAGGTLALIKDATYGLSALNDVLTAMKGSGFSTSTDSLEAIRNRGDAAWTTGSGASAANAYTLGSLTRTIGDDDGGTLPDTTTVNGTSFVVGEVAAANPPIQVDGYATATSSAEGPAELLLWAQYSGSVSHYLTVYAYSFTDAVYEPLGVIQSSTAIDLYHFALNPQHIDKVTNPGRVSFRVLHSPVSGVGTHYFAIDKALVTTTSAPAPSLTVGDIWDEVISPSQHNVKNSAAYKLWRQADTLVYTGIAVSGTANTITLAEGDSSEFDGAYDPAAISIVAGTGVGQTRLILGYKGHPDHIAIVDRDWKVIPDATSEVVVTSHPGREHVNEGLAQGGTTDTITFNTLASPFDDAYNAQVVFLRSGPGQDQARRVLDYDGTTKVATVSRPWAPGQEPTSETAYVVLPTGAISDNCIGRAVWTDHYADYAVDSDSAAATLDKIKTIEIGLGKLFHGYMAASMIDGTQPNPLSFELSTPLAEGEWIDFAVQNMRTGAWKSLYYLDYTSVTKDSGFDGILDHNAWNVFGFCGGFDAPATRFSGRTLKVTVTDGGGNDGQTLPTMILPSFDPVGVMSGGNPPCYAFTIDGLPVDIEGAGALVKVGDNYVTLANAIHGGPEARLTLAKLLLQNTGAEEALDIISQSGQQAMRIKGNNNRALRVEGGAGAEAISVEGYYGIDIVANSSEEALMLAGNSLQSLTAVAVRDINNQTPAPDSLGEAVNLGGDGGGGATDETIAALTEAIGKLIADTLVPGTVANPYQVESDQPVVLYANTDMDDVEFTVGPQWSIYLQEPDAQAWFTVKTTPRDVTSLLDVQGVIDDPVAGVVKMSFTQTQLAVKAGTYFWQMQVRRPIYAGDPPVLQSTKKRMMMEGKVYIKPTFKV